MFLGLCVTQLTPLLTGVSAVPTVLRVLWREDGPRVSVVLCVPGGGGDTWTSHPSHLLSLLCPHHLT